jgi:membrane associated rhomboid family serine protease
MGILDDIRLQFKTGGVRTRLLFANAALFAVPFIFFGILRLFNIEVHFLKYISLSSNPQDLLWKPWSIVTYAFFHADLWHILFNLLMLNFSGRVFTTFYTERQLLGLYFSGAVFAGLFYMLGYAMFPALSGVSTSLIGASASVMAILFAAVAYAPMMSIRLMIFGTVRLWHIALVLTLIDLVQLAAENTGGHLSHLAGAGFGYMFTRMIKSGIDIGSWPASIIDSVSWLWGGGKRPFKAVHKTYREQGKKSPRIVTRSKVQQQIDEILDKISKSGYDSLTKEEKEFLFKAGKD